MSSRRERNGITGWQDEGVPTLPTIQVPFTLPTCQGQGVQSWQYLVLSGRGKWLETGQETQRLGKWQEQCGLCPSQHPRPPTWAFSIRRPLPWPLVPSELCPLPALRMLPTLPSLPTLFLSPAAGGRSKAVRAPGGPANCLAACQNQTPTPVPSTALWEDVPGLSGLRPTRGSWP